VARIGASGGSPSEYTGRRLCTTSVESTSSMRAPLDTTRL